MESFDVDDIVREIQERLPAASTWTYIAIWGLADMMRRMELSPKAPRFEDVHFPHTKIPLFTKEQAKKLEEAWPQHLRVNEGSGFVGGLAKQQGQQGPQGQQGQQGPQGQQGQQGGRLGFPPSLKDIAAGPKAIGKAISVVTQNPELLSIDDKFSKITGSLDGWDDAITDAAKQYGLPALEAAAPDPKFILPLGPIPVPVMIPVRIVLPTLNAILELVRVASTLLSPIEILGKPTTLLMVFLDLARGNLYHALFTMLGMWGKYPMYGGIVLKILRDAYMLIAPDIRTDLRSAIYRSGKSMFTGWVIWLFGIVAPEMVRRPIVALLDKVREIIETYNDQATKAEVKATAALKGFGSVEIPKMPSSHIPTIGDLYILQEYVHNPNVYCHPEVAPLLAELRGIPPMALFLDLFNLPAAGTREHEAACAAIAEKSVAQQLAPKITLA
jgi:hypothetical protein